MSHLQEAHARLLASLPTVIDIDHDVSSAGEITSTVDLNFGGYLWFRVFEDDRLEVSIENIATIPDYEGVGPIDDGTILHHLRDAMIALSKLPPNDEWDTFAEHGYADAIVLGTETWEDQTQFEQIKQSKGIPEHWHLTKCRNFDGRRLQEMAEWLTNTCTGEFKRIGWSSGCSTTVGIAFQKTSDAFFYRLRWQ